MIAKGGCAHSCSDKFKAAAQTFVKCPKAPSASGKALAAFDKACPATTAAAAAKTTAAPGRSRRDDHAAKLCPAKARRDSHEKDACAGARMRKDGHSKAEKSCDCLKQIFCAALDTEKAAAEKAKAAAKRAKDTADALKAVVSGCPAPTTTAAPGRSRRADHVKKLCGAKTRRDGHAKDACADSKEKKSCDCLKQEFCAAQKKSAVDDRAQAVTDTLATYDAACPATTAAPGRSRRDAHAAKLCDAKARRDGHAKDACAGSRMRKDGHSTAEKSCDCLKQEFCAAKTAAAADAPPATTTAAPTTKPAAKAPGATTTAAEESSAFQMASSVAATFAAVGAAMVF